MFSSELNNQDVEMFPVLSVHDTGKPKVSEQSKPSNSDML